MKNLKPICILISFSRKFSPLFVMLVCFLSFQMCAAQESPKPSKTPVIPQPKCPPGIPCSIVPNPILRNEAKKVVRNDSFAPAEKSIVTESKVNITLCVKEGNVKINGWDRDEIRAYVADGSQVGFKVVQENPKTKKPVWIKVLGFDPSKNKEAKPEDCLSGSEIELDVPRNANVSLNSGESEIKIESVAKVSLESLGGDIYLNDIAKGIDVTTWSGDLTVEKSSGQIVLTNAAGNIIALDVSPSEIGDTFKAKTNGGRIILKAIQHRQIEAISTTGAVNFDGEMLSGGQYRFSASNGSILLTMPPASACKINALFGFGAFSSEIPLQNALKKEQSLSAQIGAADSNCNLSLTTGSGNIRIRKRQ